MNFNAVYHIGTPPTENRMWAKEICGCVGRIASVSLINARGLLHIQFWLAFVIWLLSTSSGFAADEPTKIVMLGTGSPPPTPAWSGPATAIVAGGRAYLVDFGPGVIRRAAAAAEKGIATLEPSKITIAFATHLHSDHTVGYPDLIFTPWVMNRKELDVYGPKGIEDMTKHVLRAWGRDIDIRTKGMEHQVP